MATGGTRFSDSSICSKRKLFTALTSKYGQHKEFHLKNVLPQNMNKQVASSHNFHNPTITPVFMKNNTLSGCIPLSFFV